MSFGFHPAGLATDRGVLTQGGYVRQSLLPLEELELLTVYVSGFCRKLNALMEEYIARVGQQAAVIYCTPGKSQHQPHYYKVVGSQPLQNIVSVYLLTVLHNVE